MSLSLKTLKKAEKIIQSDLIQKVDSNSFLIQGSKGNVYEVTNGKCNCIGYRIKGDCYHAEATRIYQK